MVSAWRTRIISEYNSVSARYDATAVKFFRSSSTLIHVKVNVPASMITVAIAAPKYENEWMRRISNGSPIRAMVMWILE